MSMSRIPIVVATVFAVALFGLGASAGNASQVASPEVRSAKFIPTLSQLKRDYPPTYRNDCHLRVGISNPKVCRYGSKSGKKRVLLFGDSHAAAWFGAVNRISKSKRYKMLNVTKSSCSSVPNGGASDCRAWQSKALKQISAGKMGRIDLAIITNKSPAVNATTAQVKRWSLGLDRTLKAVSKRAKRIIVLRDQPQLPIGTGYTSCLKRYLSNPRRCGAPASRSLSASIWAAEKKSVSKFPKARAVDLTTRVCSGGFCSPVEGRYIVMRDDHHFSQTFSKGPLSKVLRPHMVRAIASR